eukprot:354853-Chlamydomonas_euryale.AAC.1
MGSRPSAWAVPRRQGASGAGGVGVVWHVRPTVWPRCLRSVRERQRGRSEADCGAVRSSEV